MALTVRESTTYGDVMSLMFRNTRAVNKGGALCVFGTTNSNFRISDIYFQETGAEYGVCRS